MTTLPLFTRLSEIDKALLYSKGSQILYENKGRDSQRGNRVLQRPISNLVNFLEIKLKLGEYKSLYSNSKLNIQLNVYNWQVGWEEARWAHCVREIVVEVE